VLRTREFVMKDSYTFDRDADGLDQRYELHVGAYDRIMQRSGLRWYAVEADVGMMGGFGAHEYMAPCAAGENDVVLTSSYAANIEVASADPAPVALPDAPDAPAALSTPGLTTVREVAAHLGLPHGALLKAYPVVIDGDGEPRMVLVLVRGDHQVGEIKLALALGVESRPARPEEIAEQLGPPGFIGPVGIPEQIEIVLDRAAATGPEGGYVTGAGRPDEHLSGVVPGRDFAFREVDVRMVVEGDTIAGEAVKIESAIEVANIFKLGTRFSEPLGATYLDEAGAERPIWMGSYGIGPARIVAAAVEQFADEHGISWPRSLAPFALHLVVIGKPGSPERDAAEQLYEALLDGGVEVLYDDRDLGPGEKFADAELLGCPLRITIGKRALESGEAEVQVRRGREQAPGLRLDAGAAELVRAVGTLWQSLP
jgi:prolyl-tRNA synthetase